MAPKICSVSLIMGLSLSEITLFVHISCHIELHSKCHLILVLMFFVFVPHLPGRAQLKENKSLSN